MAGTIPTICNTDFEQVSGFCLGCCGQRQCSSLNMAPKMTIRGHFTDAAGDSSPDLLPKSANANLRKRLLPLLPQPPFSCFSNCANQSGGVCDKRRLSEAS